MPNQQSRMNADRSNMKDAIDRGCQENRNNRASIDWCPLSLYFSRIYLTV